MPQPQPITSELLTIQKFIYLLDDFHYSVFANNLKLINAQLPLKLAHTIRQRLPAFDTHEQLCTKMYGKYGKNERLNFNQLASYSFKLSSYLAINYPCYLSSNYSQLQKLVNEGKSEQANFLAKVLLDIAEKTEDHQTLIFILKFLVQQAFLMKQNITGVKLTHQLNAICESEKLCMDILSALRLNLNMALDATVSAEKLAEYKKRFLSLHNHASASVRLLSKYAYIYTLFYHEPDQFKDAVTFKLIEELEKDINNYSFIIFPFGFDLKSNFSFYKLNSPFVDLTSKQGKKEFDELERHYSSVLFWKGYLNIPEIFAIALRTNHYLTNYHYLVHRSDYYKIIPAEELKEIEELAAKCKDMLGHNALGHNYKNDLINLELLYSGLLILSGGKGIKKGAEEMEAMLISYQQISLAGTAGSIFLFLMIAYFSMRDYKRCASTFKRYKRVIKSESVDEDTDIEVHAYYYLSQWLSLKSRQYLEKLMSTQKRALKETGPSGPSKAIDALITYFELPVEAQ